MSTLAKPSYTVAETREMLGIGHTKVFDLIKTGKLKAHKIGTRTVFKAESIQEFLDSLEEAN